MINVLAYYESGKIRKLFHSEKAARMAFEDDFDSKDLREIPENHTDIQNMVAEQNTKRQADQSAREADKNEMTALSAGDSFASDADRDRAIKLLLRKMTE